MLQRCHTLKTTFLKRTQTKRLLKLTENPACSSSLLYAIRLNKAFALNNHHYTNLELNENTVTSWINF